jgi:outer membrane protein assembly factor BamB
LLKDLKFMRIIWCLFCLLFCSVNAFGQTVLWDMVEDVSGGLNVMRAITLSTRSAVFIGNADNSAADVHDFVIQSLRRKTGSVRWTDRGQEFPGLVTSLQIASFQGRVFASGYTTGPDNGTDIVVRGYDALHGTLLWNSVWDAGRDDLPQAIVAGPTAVIVVGYGGNSPGHALNFIVRAYDPKDGTVLWEDRVERTDLATAAWAVAITRNRVFVAGNTISQTNTRDLLLRVYNVASGALLWETTRPLTSPTEIKASGGRVFLAGSSSDHSFVGAWDAKSGALLWEDNSTDPGIFLDISVKGDRVVAAGSSQSTVLVRAYDVEDGRLEWQDQTSCGKSDRATGVALNDRAVYVVGSCSQDFVYSEMLVRSYGANDGTMLWEDRSHRTGGFLSVSGAVDVALGRNRLFVAGSETEETSLGGGPVQEFVVRAYDIQADGLTCSSETPPMSQSSEFAPFDPNASPGFCLAVP